MNNAPLTLILIASLGIVAVISLGVFFALRPRTVFDDKITYYEEESLLSQRPEKETIPKPESE